jgi:hypothetical protein
MLYAQCWLPLFMGRRGEHVKRRRVLPLRLQIGVGTPRRFADAWRLRPHPSTYGHGVQSTDPNQPTVWLAIHHRRRRWHTRPAMRTTASLNSGEVRRAASLVSPS